MRVNGKRLSVSPGKTTMIFTTARRKLVGDTHLPFRFYITRCKRTWIMSECVNGIAVGEAITFKRKRDAVLCALSLGGVQEEAST